MADIGQRNEGGIGPDLVQESPGEDRRKGTIFLTDHGHRGLRSHCLDDTRLFHLRFQVRPRHGIDRVEWKRLRAFAGLGCWKWGGVGPNPFVADDLVIHETNQFEHRQDRATQVIHYRLELIAREELGPGRIHPLSQEQPYRCPKALRLE